MKKKATIILITIATIILLFFTGVSILTKATPTDDGRLDWLKTVKISHGGLYNNVDIPENSLKAFKNSAKENLAIKLDVQLTKDNKVVVFHDYNLERMTGVNKKLEELDYIDIIDLKLLNTKEYIPTLKEVLELVDGRVPILIEIKNEGKVGILESELYEEIKSYNGDLAIESFNPFALSWFKVNAEEIPRGQLSGSLENSNLSGYEKFVLKNLLLNFESKPSFIVYEIDYLPNRIVRFQRSRKIPVLGWTSDSKVDIEKVKLNCDNIIY